MAIKYWMYEKRDCQLGSNSGWLLKYVNAFNKLSKLGVIKRKKRELKGSKNEEEEKRESFLFPETYKNKKLENNHHNMFKSWMAHSFFASLLS